MIRYLFFEIFIFIMGRLWVRYVFNVFGYLVRKDSVFKERGIVMTF